MIWFGGYERILSTMETYLPYIRKFNRSKPTKTKDSSVTHTHLYSTRYFRSSWRRKKPHEDWNPKFLGLVRLEGRTVYGDIENPGSDIWFMVLARCGHVSGPAPLKIILKDKHWALIRHYTGPYGDTIGTLQDDVKFIDLNMYDRLLLKRAVRIGMRDDTE